MIQDVDLKKPLKRLEVKNYNSFKFNSLEKLTIFTGVNASGMCKLYFESREMAEKIRKCEERIKKRFDKTTLSEDTLKKIRMKFLKEVSSFNENIRPIDCILLTFSQKKKESELKIIKPIKEKIISVTDLLIIGNSRVLRI